MPAWDREDPNVSEAWDLVSARYAGGVSGSVRAIVGPGGIRIGSVFNTVELSTLQNNEAVTGVEYICVGK